MRWLLLSVLLLAGALQAEDEIVIASYNLENYTDGASPAHPASRQKPASPKTVKAIDAIIRIVAEIHPDILGVCEMGSREVFQKFRERLKQAGLPFEYAEYVDGPDQERHLALLSRFPFASQQSAPEVDYTLDGVPEKVRRGFLDVTIQVTAKYQLRMVGAHLKSKLAAPEGEALIRRNEAHLLRAHLEKIMNENPATNLLVYGDFNSLKNEPVVQEIMGARNSPARLSDLWLKDNVGDRWTHYWKVADEYSRLDYFFVNNALDPEVQRDKSRIYRSENWFEASDHRPILTTLLPEDHP